MDPPAGQDRDGFLNERERLLKSIRPLTSNDVVRGQFEGYRSLDGVDPNSDVETFVALRMHVDSWRWAEVPFYIRAGKRLAVTATEVLVELQRPPRNVFDQDRAGHPNHVVFRLGPDVSISLGARTKQPGEAMAGEDVELMAHHQLGDVMEPYERLLTEAMDGDLELFSRQDIVETSWRIVDPILDGATPLATYAQGSWGPKEADALIAGVGAWHEPGRKG
jgi:glucose-6-phosphate 1-dehydrogenase